mgnify:CR=1 FL=1
MQGCGVEAVCVASVDVQVVDAVFAGRVVGNVLELALVVIDVGDAMGMIAVLPDFALKVFADGVGEAPFDELDAAFDGLVGSGCQKDMKMVGHDDEAVESIAGLIAVAEEGV